MFHVKHILIALTLIVGSSVPLCAGNICCCHAIGGGLCCAEQNFCTGYVPGCLCKL